VLINSEVGLSGGIRIICKKWLEISGWIGFSWTKKD
jgi:hypothetical protein